MRDPNRIDDFMQRLHDIWKQECPDWRFGQMIFNVFNQLDFDPFMIEDNQMLYEFERYFNLVDESEDPIAVHKDLLISQTYKQQKKEKPKIYNYEERLITRTTINEEGGLKIYDRKRSNNRRATRIIEKDNDRTKTNRKKECGRRTKHKDSI